MRNTMRSGWHDGSNGDTRNSGCRGNSIVPSEPLNRAEVEATKTSRRSSDLHNKCEFPQFGLSIKKKKKRTRLPFSAR
ncbi:hypothetical protein PUN28_016050 [Cardiocondyla obscurior]|uniref:Uncharacterized protein n=1 Tax=Cardiocondyla obscurior TaxID=286306 RepID=A0AAW2EUE9_9HYME